MSDHSTGDTASSPIQTTKTENADMIKLILLYLNGNPDELKNVFNDKLKTDNFREAIILFNQRRLLDDFNIMEAMQLMGNIKLLKELQANSKTASHVSADVSIEQTIDRLQAKLNGMRGNIQTIAEEKTRRAGSDEPNSGATNADNANSGATNTDATNSDATNSGATNTGDANSGVPNANATDNANTNTDNANSGATNADTTNPGVPNADATDNANTDNANSGATNTDATDTDNANADNAKSDEPNSGATNVETVDGFNFYDAQTNPSQKGGKLSNKKKTKKRAKHHSNATHRKRPW